MQSMEYYLPLPFFSHAHQTKESSLPILISIPSLLLPLQHFISITSLSSTKRTVSGPDAALDSPMEDATCLYFYAFYDLSRHVRTAPNQPCLTIRKVLHKSNYLSIK